MYVDETNAERRKRWATKDSQYYYPQEYPTGPLHGPWPRPDPEMQDRLTRLLNELFADMPGDEP